MYAYFLKPTDAGPRPTRGSPVGLFQCLRGGPKTRTMEPLVRALRSGNARIECTRLARTRRAHGVEDPPILVPEGCGRKVSRILPPLGKE